MALALSLALADRHCVTGTFSCVPFWESILLANIYIKQELLFSCRCCCFLPFFGCCSSLIFSEEIFQHKSAISTAPRTVHTHTHTHNPSQRHGCIPVAPHIRLSFANACIKRKKRKKKTKKKETKISSKKKKKIQVMIIFFFSFCSFLFTFIFFRLRFHTHLRLRDLGLATMAMAKEVAL